MKTVNMHEAKTHLSKLVAKAVEGEAFLIAKAGKPLVKVEAIHEAQTAKPSRIGFMKGQFKMPDDFKTRWADEVEEMFYGKS